MVIGGHDTALRDTTEVIYAHVISLTDAYTEYFMQKDADGDFEFAILLNGAGWRAMAVPAW